MRVLVAIPVLVALLVAGCSTYESKYAAQVAKLTADPPQQIKSSVKAGRAIIGRYEPRARALPTDTFAVLADAAAVGYLGIRDYQSAADLQAASRTYATALLSREIRLSSGVVAFAQAGKRVPDPVTTADAGNALIDTHLATFDPAYATAVRDLARSMTSPQLGWGKVPPARPGFDPGDSAGHYAVRLPSGPPGYDIPATATAARFLKRAADVDIAPGSPLPIGNYRANHRAILRERAMSKSAYTTVVTALAGPRWPEYVGGSVSMGAGQLARTTAALASTGQAILNDLAYSGQVALWNRTFLPTGQPRSSEEIEGAPIGLLVRGFATNSGFASDALTWIGQNPDRTGLPALVRSWDVSSQAFYCLALERFVWFLQRGAVPQP